MNPGDQLTGIIQDLQLIKVESTLILGAILLLIAGLIRKSNAVVRSIYAGTILLALYFNWQGFAFRGVLTDSLFLTESAQSVTGIFLLSGLLILLYRRADTHATEFYFLILSLIVGSVFIMKANSFLVTYLAVELTSFTAYILTNFLFKKESHEAGIKYLLFGAVSSAIMLFGFGLLYGASGEFFISDLEFETFGLVENTALILIISGLLFKASIVPFHIWVPATYQSAPNDATAMLSVVPKLGGLVLLQRIFSLIEVQNQWILNMCLILGMLTIVSGTLSALQQTHARRLISFGAVAHSGFLLPLVLMTTETAVQSFWWYSVVYALMNISIFYFLDRMEEKGLNKLEDYSGFGNKAPIVFVSLTVLLISLTGLPPLGGFTAKLFLFTSLWEQYQISGEMLFMVYLMVTVFATVVSLFFYLKIPYHLFLVKQETSPSIDFSVSAKFIATLFSIVLLLLFFVPHIVTVMQQLLNHTP